jgi:hypothetical protein
MGAVLVIIQTHAAGPKRRALMKQTRRSTNTLLAIVTAILFAIAELPSLLFAAAAPKTDGQGGMG